MQCAKCGSEDLKRLELIIDEGSSTQVSEAKGTARGAGGGSNFYATTSVQTTTKSTSNLAKKVAPPKKKPTLGTVILGVLIAPIGGVVIAGILGVTIDPDPTIGGMILLLSTILIFFRFVLIARKAASFNKNEFPAIYNSWKNSFHCGRCGEIFEGDF